MLKNVLLSLALISTASSLHATDNFGVFYDAKEAKTGHHTFVTTSHPEVGLVGTFHSSGSAEEIGIVTAFTTSYPNFAFLSLQGWTDEDLGVFMALPQFNQEKFGVLTQKFEGDTSLLALIYNKGLYGFQEPESPSNEDGKVDTASKFAYLFATFTRKDDPFTINVLNMHVKSPVTPDEVKASVENFPRDAFLVVAGNLNCDLRDTEIEDAEVWTVLDGTEVVDETSGSTRLATTDAIIFRDLKSTVEPEEEATAPASLKSVTPQENHHDLGKSDALPLLITLSEGFSVPEGNHRWTDGRSAKITLNLDADLGQRLKKIAFLNTFCFVFPGHNQEITVKLGSETVGTYHYTPESNSHLIEVEIPPHLTGTVPLEFDMPNSTSPNNGDPRTIGIGFHEVVLTTIPRS